MNKYQNDVSHFFFVHRAHILPTLGTVYSIEMLWPGLSFTWKHGWYAPGVKKMPLSHVIVSDASVRTITTKRDGLRWLGVENSIWYRRLWGLSGGGVQQTSVYVCDSMIAEVECQVTSGRPAFYLIRLDGKSSVRSNVCVTCNSVRWR